MTASYIQVPPDSTGKQVATNELSGKQYQIVNLADSSGAEIAPLTDAQLRASAVPVSVAGVATDATLQAIQALQEEVKNLTDTMVFLLSSMLEKMPRSTGSDQSAVAVESISGNLTLGTVSTIGTLNQAGTKYVSGDNINMAGLQHIYNNIVVS